MGLYGLDTLLQINNAAWKMWKIFRYAFLCNHNKIFFKTKILEILLIFKVSNLTSISCFLFMNENFISVFILFISFHFCPRKHDSQPSGL